MVEAPKMLLYVVILDDGEKGEGKENESFRYTRSMLQNALQLMGCKARHAFKISQRVFEVMRRDFSGDASNSKGLETPDDEITTEHGENEDLVNGYVCKDDGENHLGYKEKERNNSKTFELYKQETTVVVKRETFLDVVCDALSEYKYVGPKQRADLVLACRIKERKESITVLLCGTSGCGKSTLSSLLGCRLGITTVISTDSIRHMMRSFVEEKQNPLLWSSTYHAGEHLDPVAVAEAKAKRKAQKLAHGSHVLKEELSNGGSKGSSNATSPDGGPSNTELIGAKQMAVEGFKAQSEMVIDSLDRLITAWEERKDSVIVEGVHLSLNFVMGLMKKHPSIIPFMVYISNEDKHLERFAVRAKYMTLDPERNKYVKYIRNIRTIQEYLCNRADKHMVPKINNTNVDRSVAAIHATVFSCLRRREAGEQLYDPTTNTVPMVDEEYRNQCAANSLSSKGMFQLIQRKGSTRHLMALLNTDGSVAKAWPVESDDKGKPISGNGCKKSIGSPVYGPVQIGKAEPVNLQFGIFGISAFPNDAGGTSHTGSIDESRAESTENGSSRYQSSCCSSPRMFDGPAKEPKEEELVYGSDEEADDLPEVDSDDDFSVVEERIHDEMEGSVDEESTKSDEEYDDLAMQDGEENGYVSDDDEEECEMKLMPPYGGLVTDHVKEKYEENLENFTQRKQLSDLSCSYSSLVLENHASMPVESDASLRRHSVNVSAMGNNGFSRAGPLFSGGGQR